MRPSSDRRGRARTGRRPSPLCAFRPAGLRLRPTPCTRTGQGRRSRGERASSCTCASQGGRLLGSPMPRGKVGVPWAQGDSWARRHAPKEGGCPLGYAPGRWVSLGLGGYAGCRGNLRESLGLGSGGWSRNRTGVHGFAVRCMTTLPSSPGGDGPRILPPGRRVGRGAAGVPVAVCATPERDATHPGATSPAHARTHRSARARRGGGRRPSTRAS